MSAVYDNDYIKLIIFTLKMIGLAPYRLGKKREDVCRSYVLSAYNITLSVLVMYNTWFAELDTKNNIAYSNKTEMVDIAYDVVDVFASIYVCLFILMSIKKYKNFSLIFYDIATLSKASKKLGIESDTHRMKINYLKKLAIILFIASIIFLADVYLNQAAGVKYTPFYWIAVFLPRLFSTIVTIIFESLVLFLCQQFWCIGRTISTLSDYHCRSQKTSDFKKHPFKIFDERSLEKEIFENMHGKYVEKEMRGAPNDLFIKNYQTVEKNYNVLNELRQLRQLHFHIVEVGKKANGAYGPHFLFISIIYFCGCVLNVYTSVRFYVTEKIDTEYGTTLMWSVIYICLMFYLISTCNKAAYEAYQIKQKIYRFLINLYKNENKMIENELRNFLLQLVHNPLEFTAMGLFTLNSELMFGFLVAVLSNVIYIVQFDILNFKS